MYRLLRHSKAAIQLLAEREGGVLSLRVVLQLFLRPQPCKTQNIMAERDDLLRSAVRMRRLCARHRLFRMEHEATRTEEEPETH